jgi:hypothetical protein
LWQGRLGVTATRITRSCKCGAGVLLSLGAVAFFKFFQAATWARIITAHLFKRVTYWLCMGVTAVWAMHVAVIMSMFVAVIMWVIVLAIWAVNVGFLLHGAYSGM